MVQERFRVVGGAHPRGQAPGWISCNNNFSQCVFLSLIDGSPLPWMCVSDALKGPRCREIFVESKHVTGFSFFGYGFVCIFRSISRSTSVLLSQWFAEKIVIDIDFQTELLHDDILIYINFIQSFFDII